MLFTTYTLNLFLPIIYAITFGIYLFDFIKGGEKIADVKRLFLFLSLFLHTIYLIARTFTLNHPPITNVFEIFTVLAFAISFSYFVLELVTDVRGTGPFIIIISLLFQIISSIFIIIFSEIPVFSFIT